MNWDTEEIANFPKEYKEMNKNLSKRQIELLDGAEIKSHEGMVFGGMYSDWKKRKGYDVEENVKSVNTSDDPDE